MSFLIFLISIGNGQSTHPKHVVSGQAHLGNKPWLLYTKKWTGGVCDFNKKRDDCAICVTEGCQCPSFHKNRCYDCSDARICIADGTKMAPYKIWTRKEKNCECTWNKKLGKACACCFDGGKQCDSYKVKDRCVGKNDPMKLCDLDKIKDIDIDDPDALSDGYDDHDDDHQNEDPEMCDRSNGDCSHEEYPIPNSPSSAVVQEILSQMEDAFHGEEHRPGPITEVPKPGDCQPSEVVYVPLFFWPSANEDNSGEQKCRDPFWLSLRHGGPNINIVVQTRTIPKKVQELEQRTIQSCIDHVVTGDTKVLGYVDADFQHRPMTDILDDIKAWDTMFKKMDGIYLDPIGISLKGNDLNMLLTKMAEFIRKNVAEFETIVFSPQPDFYRF